jgi:hypothetical protein
LTQQWQIVLGPGKLGSSTRCWGVAAQQEIFKFIAKGRKGKINKGEKRTRKYKIRRKQIKHKK